MTSICQQCHAELVSAPHMQGVQHVGYLSYGVLKQVQDDFRFSTCHGYRTEACWQRPLRAGLKQAQTDRPLPASQKLPLQGPGGSSYFGLYFDSFNIFCASLLAISCCRVTSGCLSI